MNPVSANGTNSVNAKKQAKHIVVRSVTCTSKVDDGGISKKMIYSNEGWMIPSEFISVLRLLALRLTMKKLMIEMFGFIFKSMGQLMVFILSKTTNLSFVLQT